jgi:hypothetical protein
MYEVFKISLASLSGTIFFIIGFVIGSIIDAIFFRIYKRIDPDENNNGIMFGILFFQIFALILIELIFRTVKLIPEYTMLRTIFDLGYLFSQIYMVEYAMKRFSNMIYDRGNNETNKKSLLEIIPGLDHIFENEFEKEEKLKLEKLKLEIKKT